MGKSQIVFLRYNYFDDLFFLIIIINYNPKNGTAQ